MHKHLKNKWIEQSCSKQKQKRIEQSGLQKVIFELSLKYAGLSSKLVDQYVFQMGIRESRDQACDLQWRVYCIYEVDK